MKPLPKKHDTASVYGLGRSGRALVAHLVALGVRVCAFDDKPREALGDLPRWLSSLGVPLYAGGEGESRGDFVFRTPAMRPDSPVLCRAALRGATVMGEAEYFARLCPAPIYAVSGSDGKTTTATMLAHLLASGGRRVYLGGNIGRSLLPFLSGMRQEDACVLELSSFQLQDMDTRFAVGVLTNLTPNHLNWHKSFEEYAAAKRRLALSSDLPVLRRGLFEDLDARRFSVEGDADFTLRDGVLWGLGVPLCHAAQMRLSGRHNIENLLAASAAAAGEITPRAVRELAMRFGGVAHRAEWVCDVRGVRYINSSIDTTPSRTAITLAALSGEGRLHLLLGGREKGLSYEVLTDALRGKRTLCYLFGESAPVAARALAGTGIAHASFLGMRDAFLAASGAAERGDTVLLSPAATAFDEFVDYEARGECFRRLCGQIKEQENENDEQHF
ncbi:MAG: UDP-N-acetylmuramoyl-L-alanine--D-glutamate ligase [Clostridia bacterium]|nr:UDP-N-acetylmuramoyl-L-alanine--D-glutamate ligase [Clostridia bacterium]